MRRSRNHLWLQTIVPGLLTTYYPRDKDRFPDPGFPRVPGPFAWPWEW